MIKFSEVLILQAKKRKLQSQLELSKNLKKSSDLKAKSDLLTKLNKIIKKNEKEASYLEEDYHKLKNQVYQIKQTIKNYDLEIKQLNKQKKLCFSQINRIVRQTEDSSNTNKDKDLKKLGIKINIPNSEKIRMLQIKAKNLSYNIKQLNTQKEESNFKLQQINSKYEVYKEDYEKILEEINIDKIKIKEIQTELNKLLEKINRKLQPKEELEPLKSLRSISQIEDEIKIVNKKLLERTNDLNDLKLEEKFSSIKEDIIALSALLNEKINDLKLEGYRDKNLEIFENYRKFEMILGDMEKIINIFMSKINLMVQFTIKAENSFSNFFIASCFKRKNKNTIEFNDLTTPEKVFYVIILYFSLNIILKKKHIIISNLFIPNDYNKRGSILRTIRKTLPLFANEENLKNLKLIFIISNLEIKEKLENIDIIEIKKS